MLEAEVYLELTPQTLVTVLEALVQQVPDVRRDLSALDRYYSLTMSAYSTQTRFGQSASMQRRGCTMPWEMTTRHSGHEVLVVGCTDGCTGTYDTPDKSTPV